LANSALSNKIIQDVSRKTVIREIPEDIPLQEEIEIENLNLLIFNAFRATTKKNQLEDSQTVCIEFNGKTLPEKVINEKAILSNHTSFQCGCVSNVAVLLDTSVSSVRKTMMELDKVAHNGRVRPIRKLY